MSQTQDSDDFMADFLNDETSEQVGDSLKDMYEALAPEFANSTEEEIRASSIISGIPLQIESHLKTYDMTEFGNSSFETQCWTYIDFDTEIPSLEMKVQHLKVMTQTELANKPRISQEALEEALGRLQDMLIAVARKRNTLDTWFLNLPCESQAYVQQKRGTRLPLKLWLTNNPGQLHVSSHPYGGFLPWKYPEKWPFLQFGPKRRPLRQLTENEKKQAKDMIPEAVNAYNALLDIGAATDKQLARSQRRSSSSWSSTTTTGLPCSGGPTGNLTRCSGKSHVIVGQNLSRTPF